MRVVKSIPAADYERKVTKQDALNEDIRRTIEESLPKSIKQTKQFAKRFESDTRTEAAGKVWRWFKRNIKFVKDDSDRQIVQFPSHFINAGSKGDCKSFSESIAAVLANLGMPVAFRYAAYPYKYVDGLGYIRNYDKTPTHVYVVTQDEKGKEIIVDAVWNRFNSEKKYLAKIDKLMQVETISGIGEDIGRHRKKKSGKGKKKLKRFLLAAPRRAYRTLVALNVHGLATKLAALNQKNPGALKSKWEKMGGKISDLMKSVNAGAKRKKILGLGDVASEKDFHKYFAPFTKKGMGSLAAVATILGLAAPIIIALAPLLKAVGVDKVGGVDIDALVEGSKNAAAQYGNADMAVDPTIPGNEEKFDPEKGKDDTPGGFKVSPMVIGLGVAALAAIFLLKGKK